MADVAPELFEKMQKSFQRSMENNTKAASLMKKIESGKAKYSDAGKYADEVGNALTKAFQDILSSSTLPDGKMYWNIAERTIQPMYEESYRLTSEAVKEVQQGLNAATGIGLKAQTANLDTDIIQKIMDCVCDADQYDDAAGTLYKSAQAWNRTIVDQTLKKNAEFQAKSGRSPRIIRTAEVNCCSWCADLEGVYEYKGSYSVLENVYKRHENCKCTVEYDPGTENRTQNIWSKQWHDDQNRDKIEERKSYGFKSTDSGKRSIGELTKSAIQIKDEMKNYSNNSSKWSGIININDNLANDDILGVKEWNCDISLISSADDGVIWHEMLHSGSASYYDETVYSLNQKIEEGSVEYLTQQICKEKGIEHTEGCYTDQTTALQLLNEKFQYGTDLEFAETLYNTPLSERYDWLKNKVDSSLSERGASFEDYNDVMLYIEESFKGGM